MAGRAKAISYSISDTGANVASANSGALNEAINITITGVALVAEAVTVDDALNSGTDTFSITDSAVNLAASSNVLLAKAGTVIANTAATAVETNVIGGYAKAVQFSISDTAANIVAATAAAVNEAVDITVTDTATVAQATTIEARSTSGSNTYSITDSATNLAASSNAVLTLGSSVTANTNATKAEADTVVAFTKAVVYSISDTSALVAGGSDEGRDEAVDITVTTDSVTGYGMTLVENDNLRIVGHDDDPDPDIDDIDTAINTTIDAGTEEYGITTDAVTYEPISGSVSVASSLSPVSSSVTTLGFGMAISQSTLAGSYSQTITLTLTVNP